ncbi:hypothetical protein BDEG_22573 [Batrachochytrium dendrobatidis JEL423]|uniref:Uncharacterized protein n=1 Tax=Batrachochytrium dendrobatidis (strain JEL423) TaxID=403673 RepID=A0A177WG03_BATDL|nr:hypothetical protein BDEG_22573 [Batrachochytrium dendrobatidis JEL423]
MKLVDILFVLTAAATANAILIPTDNNGSPKASGTSSQVSSPTNEPDPGTSNDWQEPMDLSLPNQSRRQPMDQPNPNTPTQNQRPTVIVAGPNIFKQGRKPIIGVIDLTTSDQDQQQPIDVAGPSTSSQYQQQPMIHDRSANTVPDQVTGLSERYQKTLDGIKQRLVESKELRKEKWQQYHKYGIIGLEHQLALVKGKEISESRHNPSTEKQLKKKYEKARKRVNGIRQKLKDFMKKHGLEFKEPELD